MREQRRQGCGGWRWIAAAALLVVGSTVARGDFPADLYTHTDKLPTCVVDADCGVGTEARCISGVCKYADVKIENVGRRVEQIEAQLADNTPSCPADDLPCVIEPEEIDTSSELASLLTDETGTGALVFADTPLLTTPRVQSYAAPANLPIAGQVDRVAIVYNALGGCVTGGGSDTCLCQDNGSSWVTLACGASGSFARTRDAVNIRNPTADHDGILLSQMDPTGPARTLVHTWARYTGTCTTAPQFAFTNSETGNPIDLTGGGNLTASGGTGAASVTTFASNDTDRTVSAGQAVIVSVANTPVCDDGAIPGTPATVASVWVVY